MNQRLKEAAAIIGLVLYAGIVVSQVDGHSSQRPHTHADMIVVSSNGLENIVGLTNDTQTNLNLQTVLEAINDSVIPTATNIIVNTNDWQNIDPTNNILQQSLDWIDDNWHTNISLTNQYATWVEASNSFASGGAFLSSTNQFIRSIGGQVSNRHMAANAVLSSNISDGTILSADLASQRAFHCANAPNQTFTLSSSADLQLGASADYNMVGNYNGSTTIVLTNGGVYLVEAEAHFPGANLNFRDINKIIQLIWNGSDIANAKADGADAIVSFCGIYALANDGNTNQLKLVATIETNVGYAATAPAAVTCSFVRLRMLQVGPYHAIGL